MAYFSHCLMIVRLAFRRCNQQNSIYRRDGKQPLQRVLTFTWIDVASCSMFLVMARFARWVHESVANLWPGMVQDSRWPSLHLFRPRVGQCYRHPVCWPLWPQSQWPLWPRWPRWRRWPRWPWWPRWPGAHREHPWHHWHPCHRPHRWWRRVWWRFHPSRCRRRRLLRVQFPHLPFTASPWLHGLYGMQARIGETQNGFGKKLGSNEDRGTSPPTRPLIKFQSEWLWL